MEAVSFQLDVYRKLSRQLRQEVVATRDAAAMARIHHLGAMQSLKREANTRELELENTLAEARVGVSQRATLH